MKPTFIPSPIFRQYMKPHQMNKLFMVDSIQAASFVNRCIREGRPIKSIAYKGTMLVRPIDVVARAKAELLEVTPPFEQQISQNIQELVKTKEMLEQQVSKLRRKLSFDLVSSKLTGATLLSEAAIVAAKMPIPDKSGVYFLIKADKVVYVGQSIKIFSRISSHVGNKDFDGIAYIPCDAKHLDILESLYIHALQPKLNGRWTNGKGIQAPIRLDTLFAL